MSVFFVSFVPLVPLVPDSTLYDTFRRGIEHEDPAIAANVIIGLIKITTYLPDRQISHLEKAFLAEGGLRERMTRARMDARGRINRVK